MPVHARNRATCDACGVSFVPKKAARENWKRKPDAMVSCGDDGCRREVTSMVRKRFEAAKDAAADSFDITPAANRLPLSASVDALAQNIGTSTQSAEVSGRVRFLVISDLHAPFQEPDALAQALAVDADVCVVNGDLTDSYSFSRFVKYEPVSWTQEKAAFTEIVGALAAKFRRVIIVTGNHDKRFAKRISEKLSSEELQELIEQGFSLDPLANVCSKYANVETPARNIDGHEVAWFHQVGDAIFCHGEKYSSAETNLVPRKVEAYFRRHADILRLSPWRLAIQAHTHALSWTPFNGGQLVVECGCLCKMHGYQLEPRMDGLPQRRGWVTFEQVDGATDLNSVRLHWWDVR